MASFGSGERDGRGADRMPGGDPARERMGIETAAAEFDDGIAADLEAVDAIGDDRPVLRQLLGPIGDPFRCAQLRSRDHVGALRQIIGKADIQDDEIILALQARQ